MANPAVIQRVADVADGFKEAAPGHWFNLYFPIWRNDWAADNTGKKDAIKRCTSIPRKVGEVLDALRTRQQAVFAAHPEGLRLEAQSTAPFATGLGNEHPVENGFAFLTPYGLPYLAGSGVKGVLRRAAEEMALFPDEYGIGSEIAPTMLDVWWLFGFEGAAGAWWPLSRNEERELSDEAKQRRALLKSHFDSHLATLTGRPDLPDFISRAIPKGKEQSRYLGEPKLFLGSLASLRQEIHTSGALDFWDVFPKPPKEALTVEIMTPHYTNYYQNGGTPNDAGQPTPIPFLAVPADSSFQFYIVCQPHYLPESLRQTWKPLLEKIFTHAFDCLGFGAKTAVGYGAMIRQGSAGALSEMPAESMQAKETKTLLQQTSFVPKEEIWDNVTLTWNPGNRELGVLGKKASVKCEPGSEMVSEDVIARLKKGKPVKAKVTVEPVGGNAFKIVKVESPG